MAQALIEVLASARIRKERGDSQTRRFLDKTELSSNRTGMRRNEGGTSISCHHLTSLVAGR